VREHAVSFGRGQSLVAVVSEPSAALRGSRPAIVVFNSGLDHRVGRSRIWVRLARRLCERGHLVVRFDHTGVGDSPPRQLSGDRLETYISEAREVMDDLEREYRASRFVLIGHCSGAVTAFKTALVDARVVGAVSINAHGLDPDADWHRYVRTRRSWRYYWRTAVWDPKRWYRALRGRIDFREVISSLSGFVSLRLFAPAAVSTVNRRLVDELRQVLEKGIALLFVFTEGDDAEEYFDLLVGDRLGQMEASGRIRVETLSECDHDFTLRAMQSELFGLVDDWTGEVSSTATDPR